LELGTWNFKKRSYQMKNLNLLTIVLVVFIYGTILFSCKNEHDHDHGPDTHAHEEEVDHEHGPDTHTHDEDPALFTLADESATIESQPHTHADGTTHTHEEEATQEQTVPSGYHVHDDGTVHADEAHTDDEVNAEGRSYHVHGDGSIHYSEASESRVSGNIVKIPANEMTKYGIGVSIARPGKLQMTITLSGEIAINADNMAHIVPRVPGIVREVKAKLGDIVKKGDVMAVIDSRELADAKADYLASLERLNLAQLNFDRKEKLWKDKITSEKEYLNSRENLAETQINLRTAKQKLIAMGFTSAYLESLSEDADEVFTRFEVVAPFNGTVIEKHIALGEDLKDDAEVFIIADLSTVWINLQVYPNELSLVRKGQRVSFQDNIGVPETHGIIDYVGPLVGTQTRTALARVVLPNPKGELRPGLFVNANVNVKTINADILVHKDHIQYLDDAPCVFVKVAQGFELRGVGLGDSDGEYFAITNGLTAGEKYATRNSFLLKSEMEKSGIGFHVHGDGTVHIEK